MQNQETNQLRTIDFTITEVPGRFITKPSVARAIGIDTDLGLDASDYVCTACQRTIGDQALMYLDMSEPQQGWRHLKPCDLTDQQTIVGMNMAAGDIRLLARKRVAAAYTIALTELGPDNKEEIKKLANTLLQTKTLAQLTATLRELKKRS
jgi:hypothetical protein